MIQPLSVALVVAGGTSSVLEDIYTSARMELLVPSTGTGPARSCSLPSLPSGRSEPSLDIVGGELVVCGGEGGEQSCLRLAETGIPSDEGGGKVILFHTGWVEMGAGLDTPRAGHVSWVNQDDLLLLSGGIYSNETEIFGKKN